MKQTRLTIEEKPTVQKDSNQYSQLLLNRVDLNDKKSYTFGVETKYEVEWNTVRLVDENNNDVINVYQEQLDNTLIVYLKFTGTITTIYGNKEIINTIQEDVTQQIIMTNRFDLMGVFTWYGIPVSYVCILIEGTARVLYTKQLSDGTFKYKTIPTSEDVDKFMCRSGYEPIAICVGTPSELNEAIKKQYDIDTNLQDSYGTLYYGLKYINAGERFNPTVDYTNPGFRINSYSFGVIKEDRTGYNGTKSPIVQASNIKDKLVDEGYKHFSGMSETLDLVKLHKSGACSGDIVNMVDFNQVSFKIVGKKVDSYTNPEGITYTSINEKYCPPAAACYLYKTLGTNKTNWFLPSIGELTTIYKLKGRRNEFNEAINILKNNGHDVDAIHENGVYSSTERKYLANTPSTQVFQCYDWGEPEWKFDVSDTKHSTNLVRPCLRVLNDTDIISNPQI